ncbi:hypothetical protein A1Q1_03259 [Trichosporon asahii var. asahii CBS 2479]|nr:hypothetical protein A1Q1_03259 [Trichosporon asahii var. asahii CBS 2479]EJT47798.1 hypothetical protein A1Q1_03259 [Trichosporon asahii var. asahii CBS 2479]
MPALRDFSFELLSSLLKHPPARLFKHTRILDVRGLFPQQCYLPALRSVFSNISVLRLTTISGTYSPYVPFGAETLVLFTSPHGPDCEANPRAFDNLRSAGLTDSSPRPVPQDVDWRTVPGTVKRVVINMGGDDQPAADLWPFIAIPPPHITEMVIIFPRVLRSNIAMVPPFSFGRTFFYPDIVAEDIAETLDGSDPRLRVTLVGFELWRIQGLDFEKLLRDQLFYSQLQGVEYEKIGFTIDFDEDGGRKVRPIAKNAAAHERMVRQLMSQVEMMTWEEYVESVGAERARIETVEYEDGTRRETRRPQGLPNDLRRERTRLAKSGLVPRS